MKNDIFSDFNMKQLDHMWDYATNTENRYYENVHYDVGLCN